jgi:hypothetical protein
LTKNNNNSNEETEVRAQAAQQKIGWNIHVKEVPNQPKYNVSLNFSLNWHVGHVFSQKLEVHEIELAPKLFSRQTHSLDSHFAHKRKTAASAGFSNF